MRTAKQMSLFVGKCVIKMFTTCLINYERNRHLHFIATGIVIIFFFAHCNNTCFDLVCVGKQHKHLFVNPPIRTKADDAQFPSQPLPITLLVLQFLTRISKTPIRVLHTCLVITI